MSLTQISLDTDMIDRLDAVAALRSLSREDALRDAIANYLEQARHISAIEEGIKAADAGDFASEAEVRAAFAKWGVDAR